jgi:hypothetical protein
MAAARARAPPPVRPATREATARLRPARLPTTWALGQRGRVVLGVATRAEALTVRVATRHHRGGGTGSGFGAAAAQSGAPSASASASATARPCRGRAMTLAIRDIPQGLPRFPISAAGGGLLLTAGIGMIGICRGIVHDATLLIEGLNGDDQRALSLHRRLRRLRVQTLACTAVLTAVAALAVTVMLCSMTIGKLHRIALPTLPGARDRFIAGKIVQQAALMAVGVAAAAA